MRRELSPSLKMIASLKFNHDVVVPQGRDAASCFALVARSGNTSTCASRVSATRATAIFTSTSWWTKTTRRRWRARAEAEQRLFAGVVALEGSISGEHGIGFAKARFLPLELWAEEIALMKRVKQAFDPHGILNPGKIFPE